MKTHSEYLKIPKDDPRWKCEAFVKEFEELHRKVMNSFYNIPDLKLEPEETNTLGKLFEDRDLNYEKGLKMKAEDYFLNWYEDVSVKTGPHPNICVCFCCAKFGHHEANVLHKPTGITAVCIQKFNQLSPECWYSKIQDPVYLADQDLRHKIKLHCEEQEKMKDEETKADTQNKSENPCQVAFGREDAVEALIKGEHARVEYTERMGTADDKIPGQMAAKREDALARERIMPQPPRIYPPVQYKNPLSDYTINSLNQLKEITTSLYRFINDNANYHCSGHDGAKKLEMAKEKLEECVAIIIRAIWGS